DGGRAKEPLGGGWRPGRSARGAEGAGAWEPLSERSLPGRSSRGGYGGRAWQPLKDRSLPERSSRGGYGGRASQPPIYHQHRRSHHAYRPGGLTVDEVRRAPVQEAVPLHLGPRHQPIQRLVPQEGPHRRAIHQEVLDRLGPELVAVTAP